MRKAAVAIENTVTAEQLEASQRFQKGFGHQRILAIPPRYFS